MLGLQRSIFNARNANTDFIKFNSSTTSTALFGCGYEGDMSMSGYIPAPDKTVVTSFFDKSGIADGFGWCGAVTFNYMTASNYVWGEQSWNSEENPSPTERLKYYSTIQSQYVDHFMIDGVLKNIWDNNYTEGTWDDNHNGNFYPVSLGRKKTTHELAFSTEYGQWDEIWFDIDFDANANRWLTLVWSIADPGAFNNFSHDVSKYGAAPSWYTKQSRYCLYDTRTGELLGTTDRVTGENFAGGVGAYSGLQNYSDYTWNYSKDWADWPSLDFEFNNINTPGEEVTDMVKVSSVWWSIGGTNGSTISAPFDPKWFYDNNDLTILDNHRPKTIAGRNAVINILISGVDESTEPYFIMGYREALAGVTAPANSIRHGLISDLSTDRP